MSNVEISRYVPGAVGRIVELHATYYSQNWGFGQFFELKVAAELTEFLSRSDPKRDGFWTALANGRVEGSVVIDGIHAADEGAHLRWFILSEVVRGRGVGRRLMEEAVGFCREKGYSCIYLWTFEGLDAARHLYEEFGFTLAEQREGLQWGSKVNEQRFVLDRTGFGSPKTDPL